MSPSALLSGEQSEHGEVIETKRSRSAGSKWKLLTAVISITKCLWHGARPRRYIELGRSSYEVSASALARVNKNPGLIEDEYGGLECFADALGTNLCNGLTRDVISRQRKKYGSNALENPRKSWPCLARKVILDRDILITAACGLVTLGVGIPAEGFSEGAKEGGSTLVPVMIAASMMFMKERWSNDILVSLHDVVDTVQILVVRAGSNQLIPASDIVVGDVIQLRSGDVVPGHGFLIDQDSLKLDLPGDCLMNQRLLLSGTVVVAGIGRMLVTAVGVNKSGQNSGRDENLVSQLEEVESLIERLGFLLVVLFFPFFLTQEIGTEASGIKKAYEIIGILVLIILTIIDIPNPWELSLMLTKAYATRKLEAGKNVKVFNPSALETMSFATVICSDKTGVIATNRVRVSKFWQPYQGFVGEEAMDPRVKELVQKGITLNSSEILASGSTENAILQWAIEDLGTDVKRMKKNHNVAAVSALDSCTSILATEIEGGAVHVHSRGSLEMVLRMCSSYYDSPGTRKGLDDDRTRSRFEDIIRRMEERGLTCVALAHRQVGAGEVETENLKDLILIGVIGVSNPCREGVKRAVRDCRTASVKLKLITEDNLFIAKAIARECGILGEEEEQVIEGTDFRNYSEEERIEKVDSIGVIANASPQDKHLMIQTLKKKGHVVAIASELPICEDADITVSMDTGGAFGANIVILDGDFASVVRVLEWGRCLYRTIQKFAQFQLTDKVVAPIVAFATMFPLTSVQLLWMSVFTNTLAAAAFATLKPTEDILKSQPAGVDSVRDPLVTNAVLRNVLLQSFYQIAVLIYFIKVNSGNTFVFNLFVLFRVFSALSTRELGAASIFRRLHRNGLFLVLLGFSVALQALFVEIFRQVFDTKRLSWLEWGKCAAIVLVTLPIGWVARLIPVPEKQIFGHCLKFLDVTSRIKRTILRKLTSLTIWAALVLNGERNREQPRGDLNV